MCFMREIPITTHFSRQVHPCYLAKFASWTEYFYFPFFFLLSRSQAGYIPEVSTYSDSVAGRTDTKYLVPNSNSNYIHLPYLPIHAYGQFRSLQSMLYLTNLTTGYIIYILIFASFDKKTRVWVNQRHRNSTFSLPHPYPSTPLYQRYI